MSIHFSNGGRSEVLYVGQGVLLAKMDLKQAYRNISVAPDFLTIGTPASDECQNINDIMNYVCVKAGLLIEPRKSSGPSSSLTFLGIEIDSVSGELHLPADKLHSIRRTLLLWRHRKACKKRDLLSVIGIGSCKQGGSG